MKKNLPELDFLRAIAAFSVIAIHVLSRQFYTNRVAYVIDTCLVYAVPLFIIISGYLLHYSNKDKERPGYGELLKKRMSKVLIPYFIWSLIYMIYSYNGPLSGTISNEFLRAYLKNLLLGQAYIHLYFMIIILQLYLVYPVLRKAIFKRAKLTLIVSFIISFYFTLEPYVKQNGYEMLPSWGAGYNFLFVARWLFYFVLGMYVVNKSDEFKISLCSNMAELTIIWGLTATCLVIYSRKLINGEPILNPLIFLYSIITFIFLYTYSLSKKIKFSRLSKYLEWFSKQSFVVYLSHLLIMEMLLKINNRIWDGNIGIILLLFGVTSTASLFAYILSLTPVASLLGGVKSSKLAIAKK